MAAATTKCVICYKEATIFGGHVHKGNEVIIAGRCKEHKDVIGTEHGCLACYGEWDEKMGIDKSFITVGYLDKNKVTVIKNI